MTKTVHIVFKDKLRFSVSIKTPNIFYEIWFKKLKESWISIIFILN